MSTAMDWVPDMGNDFATRLVLIRHEMGWNLKEAALACGVKAQSWREWELENRKPRDYEGVCQKIARKTGCNYVWLMTGIVQGKPPGPGQPSGAPNPDTPNNDGNDAPPAGLEPATLRLVA